MTIPHSAQIQALSAQLAASLDPARDYPALAAQAARWDKERPLDGLRILCGTPLFLNTSAQFAALLAGGAELEVVYSDELGFDPGLPDFLRAIGIPVRHGAAEAVASGAVYDVVLDCSALNRAVPVRLGFCELTRSGVHVYTEDPPGKPVFAADSGRIKSIETMLGTGDGCLRGLRHVGIEPDGKTVLLFGHGRVGRGIEYALKTQARSSASPTRPRGSRSSRPCWTASTWSWPQPASSTPSRCSRRSCSRAGQRW